MIKVSPLMAAGVATLFLSSFAAAQSSQSLPAGLEITGGGSGSSFPFNSTSSHSWQWHYDSSQFNATGPIQITNVSVRTLASAGATNNFDFPSLEMWMASSPTDYSVAGNGIQAGHDPVFANNMNADMTLVRAAGPFTGNAVPAFTWMSLDLTTPFVYDPSLGDDFVIELRTCSPVTSWGQSIDGGFGSGAGSVMGNRYGDTSNCAATSSGFQNNEYVPVVLIEYGPVGPGLSLSCAAGVATADMSGFTASAPIALVYGSPAVYVHGGAQCNGVVLDLNPTGSPLIVFSDANGDAQLVQGVPAAACGGGLLVQAVDVPSCVASNSAAL